MNGHKELLRALGALPTPPRYDGGPYKEEFLRKAENKRAKRRTRNLINVEKQPKG